MRKGFNAGELLAAAGGILLGVSLIFAWFTLGNRYTTLNGCHGPHADCSGWRSLAYMRFFVIFVAVAPLILSYIVARGHRLSWPRGELTAIVALMGLVFLVFRGVIDKPGFPESEVRITWGWGLAMLGAVMILIGAVWRSRESAAQRKPPGVL
jgi:hypothetical protein